jgi:hypothetical protein
MTRNFKALALALATAIAFAAFASPASAVEHHFTGQSGQNITVDSNNLLVHTPTTGGTEGFSCNKVGASGNLPAVTNTSLTVELSYSECSTHNGLSATVNSMKCHYTFQGLTTTGNPTGNEHANVEIKCDTAGAEEPKGTTTRVTIFNLACSRVPPQTLKHAVRYTGRSDTNPDGIEVQTTAHGYESITEGECKNKEGVGADQRHLNGVYTGNIIVHTPGGLTLNTTS